MYRLLIIPLVVLVIITGCSKDDDVTGTGYRIKMWSDSANKHRCEVIYQKRKVKEVLVFYNNNLMTRNTWTYKGNTITINEYNLDWNHNWTKEARYMVLTLGDRGQLIEHQYYADNGASNLYKYVWDGDKMISQELNTPYNHFEINYVYTNDLLTLVNNAGYDAGARQIWEYEEGKVSRIIDMNTDTLGVITFSYQEGLLKETIQTKKDMWFHDIRQVYSFDSNKNLSEKRYYEEGFSSNVYVTPISVTYEPGEGNLDLYWLASRGWTSVYLYPNMLPYYCIMEAFHLH